VLFDAAPNGAHRVWVAELYRFRSYGALFPSIRSLPRRRLGEGGFPFLCVFVPFRGYFTFPLFTNHLSRFTLLPFVAFAGLAVKFLSFEHPRSTTAIFVS